MTIKEIINKLKARKFNRGMDEKRAGGFWDLAGEMSVNRQIRELKVDTGQAIYENEAEQEELYNTFYEIAEACLNRDFNPPESKTREELVDEFHQLRNDDPDFERAYGDDEFDEWLIDQGIKI